MNVHFISFATSDTNYSKALDRIANQAKNIQLFDKIELYTDKNLRNDIGFWNKHETMVCSNKLGYGFWMWKPYIIKKHLEKMQNNDILVYFDAGCEIYSKNNEQNIDKDKFISTIITGGLLAYAAGPKAHCDYYTKQICYDFFGVTKQQFLENGWYVEANRLFMIKNEQNTKLIDQWWDVMNNHYETYDESEPVPNESTFKQSRGDQMILNFILFINHMLKKDIILWPHPPEPFKSTFHAHRNRRGISLLCKNKSVCECGCCVQ